MTGGIDERLRHCVTSAVGLIEISDQAPADDTKGRGVSLYLLDLVPSPQARNSRRPPLEISLRYLVSAFAEDPAGVNSVITSVMLAVMDNPDYQVEPDPVPVDLWIALKARPRPAFLLRTPLRQERPEQEAPLVRKPLVVKTAALVTVEGSVLGPEDIPLMGAVVEAPQVGRTARTDYKGRFKLDGMPAGFDQTTLIVTAKGRRARSYAGRIPRERTSPYYPP